MPSKTRTQSKHPSHRTMLSDEIAISLFQGRMRVIATGLKPTITAGSGGFRELQGGSQLEKDKFRYIMPSIRNVD